MTTFEDIERMDPIHRSPTHWRATVRARTQNAGGRSAGTEAPTSLGFSTFMDEMQATPAKSPNDGPVL